MAPCGLAVRLEGGAFLCFGRSKPLHPTTPEYGGLKTMVEHRQARSAPRCLDEAAKVSRAFFNQAFHATDT
eukprot:4026601-Alexandrium_andersonii.AAC.1